MGVYTKTELVFNSVMFTGTKVVLMNKLLIILLFISVSGCISPRLVTERIDTWDSVTIDELFNAWGVPTKEQLIANRKFYVWISKASNLSPTVGVSIGSHGRSAGINFTTLFGTSSGEDYCSRQVEVDDDNNILSITWSGDASLCYELTPIKLE